MATAAFTSACHRSKSGLLRTHRRGAQAAPLAVTRRDVLAGVAFGLPALDASAPNLLDFVVGPETTPETGTCPTCLGVVDGTLGSCSGQQGCLSSYDDRPGFFIAPWTHELRSPERAAAALQVAIEQTGGQVNLSQASEGGSYLYASFNDGLFGTDDFEFLLPSGDTTVELRAASRRPALPGASVVAGGRLKQRLYDIRQACGFEVVPVLRNRQQVLGVFDSPFDSFGPTPPSDLDYELGFIDGEAELE